GNGDRVVDPQPFAAPPVCDDELRNDPVTEYEHVLEASDFLPSAADGRAAQTPHRAGVPQIEVELLLVEQHERRGDDDLPVADFGDGQGQEALRLVLAQHDEPDRSTAVAIEHDVDRVSEVD